MIFKKPQAQITVDLKGGMLDGSVRKYAPGSTISGSVELIPEEDLEARAVSVTLGWHTEGRGDTDAREITADELSGERVLAANVTLNHEFSFTLPDQPWSFAGHYISIVWAIKVKIDIPSRRDVEHEELFVLAPTVVENGEEEPVDIWT